MKKIFTYIAIATALIATSCVQENLDGTSSEGQVSLELFCTDLETRAAGDDAFNENKITHFDYFFFSDAEGKTPLSSSCPHARVTGETVTFATDEGQAFHVLSKGAYVYVVANYPGEIPASVTTLEQILQLPVSTDFKADIKATPKPNPNGFIMDNLGADGKLTQFKPTHAGEKTTVKIGLSRLAVKTTLVINIAKEVAGIGKEEIWRPVIDKDHLFIYFVNADKTNTMAAAAMRRAEEPEDANPKDYFTYETTHPYTDNGEVDGMYQIVTAPSYTYPQKWNTGDNGEPYYKIQLGWESSIKGMSPFYYKIPIPVSATKNVFTLNRNTWYQLTLTLKVLGGTEDDYVLLDKYYCVADFADWSSPSESFGTTSDSAHYFDVPTLSYNIYSTNTLDINFICDASATALAEITSIEYYDYSGSGAERVSVPPADGSYTAAQSSTSYDHTREGRTYSLEVNDAGKYIRFTHDISDLYVVRTIKVRVYKSTEQSIYRDVTIQQHPAIELKKAGAGDVFVNGYFARVANAPEGTWRYNYVDYDDNNKTYYMSIGAERYGYSYQISNGTSGTNGYGSITDGMGDMSGISTNYYTTDIKVTAFSETNKTYTANGETVNYMIGDPRKKASEVYPSEASWSSWLHNYLANNTTYGTWTNAENIKICSQAPVDRNVIAPHFLVSSALNAMAVSGGQVTFANAVKRAATYQEAGYPAGRWRLPTEAEIAFIIARQSDGTIPILYAKNTDYWSGSGRLANAGDTGNKDIAFTNPSSDDVQTSCRFVYDLWYWGETPQTSNVYHPNQHIEN